MPMAGDEIAKLIQDGIDGAVVEMKDLAGDGDHWAATVTAAAFEGVSRVNRTRMVYDALGGRMGGELHALQLTTKTPE
ncbi:MAG: BolA family transcriptional regulator [Pacificimonas sp.]